MVASGSRVPFSFYFLFIRRAARPGENGLTVPCGCANGREDKGECRRMNYRGFWRAGLSSLSLFSGKRASGRQDRREKETPSIAVVVVVARLGNRRSSATGSKNLDHPLGPSAVRELEDPHVKGTLWAGRVQTKQMQILLAINCSMMRSENENNLPYIMDICSF